ncbi:MAG: hypothetical protein HZA90_14080 [Verrucomicrobia bacterium]|nr:hypothetical protein [Verrucomicrobiota bacterium]
MLAEPAEHELLDAYDQWRRWTEVEGLAICAEDWPKVTECQRVKRELQTVIIRRTDEAFTELPLNSQARARFESGMRSAVGELIELESRNGRILSEKRGRVLKEREDLERSAHNLRRVHGTYGNALGACWHSYS